MKFVYKLMTNICYNVVKSLIFSSTTKLKNNSTM
jgi:hypothetical protein